MRDVWADWSMVKHDHFEIPFTQMESWCYFWTEEVLSVVIVMFTPDLSICWVIEDFIVWESIQLIHKALSIGRTAHKQYSSYCCTRYSILKNFSYVVLIQRVFSSLPLKFFQFFFVLKTAMESQWYAHFDGSYGLKANKKGMEKNEFSEIAIFYHILPTDFNFQIW